VFLKGKRKDTEEMRNVLNAECGMRSVLSAECGMRSAELVLSFFVLNFLDFAAQNIILHSALRIQNIPHSAFRTPHSKHSAFRTPHSTLRTLRTQLTVSATPKHSPRYPAGWLAMVPEKYRQFAREYCHRIRLSFYQDRRRPAEFHFQICRRRACRLR